MVVITRNFTELTVMDASLMAGYSTISLVVEFIDCPVTFRT